ncbi:MAG: TipJ family phage tail tip protein, partial [Janthinobacterium lividum]
MLADLQGAGALTETTTTIVLHGALAQRYGRRHKLGVRTAPQAAYALSVMVPGFREDFQDGWYRVVRGPVATGVRLTESQLHLQGAPGGEIHFIPVARGGKNSGGTMKAVLGAVILVAAVAGAVFTGGGSLALGAAAFSVGSATVSFGAVAFFGATMLLSGVSSLLSSTTKQTSIDQKTSYSLSGNTNSTVEGTAIPVVYGRTRVGSVVGSFGYYAEDYDGSQAPSAEPTPSDGGSGGSGAIGSGGGGKGGSSGGASEAQNTLRSRAVVRVIDILSEGPIGGLVDGAKSIYFNNTPLMASDGSYNFQGVTWEVRLGYPSQDAVAGYPASEITSSVNVEVQNLGSGPITRTYSSATATAARVTIRLPALGHQNPTNGNLEAYPSLNYKIEVSPSGAGAFQTVVNDTLVNQKCTSPYERSYRFDLPSSTTTWDIRVTKISADATTANDQCSVFWEGTTLVTEQALMHPNVAYIALTIDAAAFGSQIPTRAYDIDGILCQIPQNYDPPSGSYSSSGPGTAMGTWDGASFKLASTSNPAWCLYDMLVNARYGLGLPSATAVNNTKYDLFVIG